jgi:hypothetical protein
MPRELSTIRHKENPFIVDGLLRTRTKRVTVSSRRQAILDTQTGEITAAAEIVRTQEVDSESFVKLYTAHIDSIFNLTPSTMKIFKVLLLQVQDVPNSDRVVLTHRVAVDHFLTRSEKAPSPSSFHRSLHELLEKKFIAATQGVGTYFFNPALFFNGDRVRFVHELVRRRTTPKIGTIQDDRQPQLIPPDPE